MRVLLVVAMVFAGALSAIGEFADYTFVPPDGKGLVQSAGPVRPSALGRKLQEDYPRFSIDTYAGQNEALKRASDYPNLQVGAGVTLDWTDTALFGKASRENGLYHWRSAIQSIDATALRIKVDLGQLRPGDLVWVIDTVGERPFGPYTLADSVPEGNWLPTTMGDNAVLWVSSESPTTPDVEILSLSHFYESLEEKGGNPCPLPADCAGSSALLEVSTGIGRLSVTDNRGVSALCSGALINNGITAPLEAYFLTANHCFEDIFPGTIFASALEVIWDFRADGCGGSEPNTAILSSLPRSQGRAFLGNSTTLDAMLLELEIVPVGSRGRAYLGWDTRTPVSNESVVGLHHPRGNAMKESIGVVSVVGVNTPFGRNQTTLSWSEGITEGGSSGSPSLFNGGNFRIFGMLSNGNTQSCNSNGDRVDQYSSFRDFFAQVGGFLVDENRPSVGVNTYSANVGGGGGGGEGEGEGGDGTLSGCLQNSARSASYAGDILVGGLALMTLTVLGALRTRHDA